MCNTMTQGETAEINKINPRTTTPIPLETELVIITRRKYTHSGDGICGIASPIYCSITDKYTSRKDI